MKTEVLCCYLSKCAYYDVIILENINYSNLHQYDSDNDAQCFTVNIENTLYIAFRGTESREDLIADLNIIKVPMDLNTIPSEKRPKVHNGFLQQFRSLQDYIEKDINDFEFKNIIITGHSLGGAQCTLAGLAFTLKYPTKNISCYTYGSPRVGGSTFKKLFDKHVKINKRFVNEDDPVPMVPLSLRFKHVSKLYFINKHDKIKHTIKYVRWIMFLKEYFYYLLGRESSPLDDHKCEVYLEKLKKIFSF